MTLFDGPNAAYAQEIFEQYARNPESVPAEWRGIFERAETAVASGLLLPEALHPNGSEAVLAAAAQMAVPAAPAPPAPAQRQQAQETAPAAPVTSTDAPAAPASLEVLARAVRAAQVVQGMRAHGHLAATIDPLGGTPPGHAELDPAFYGTSVEELAQVPARAVQASAGPDETVADLIEGMRERYCGPIGYEFEHLEDPERIAWLWEQVDTGTHLAPLDADQQEALLRRLSQVEGFEQFLHKTYLGQKRFSIEGTDTMVPMLDEAVRLAAAAGGSRVVMGMAHRGRLNVLTHVLNVPYTDMLQAFEGGASEALSVPGTGDVKYHMGRTTTQAVSGDTSIEVQLAPNPSHLEFVHPVVCGMARRGQFAGPDRDAARDPDAVVPVVIHGDAAFAAEGVVPEALNMARLAGYDVGGTLHIIANNQIGFTTDPTEGRSTRYSSDVAKGFDIPILHVNADDPEACLAAVRLAMAFRARYHEDVLIDLVGYRRHGHNEGDEPAYTQPVMYDVIRSHPTARARYAERLAESGALSADRAEAIQDEILERLRAAQDEARAADPYEPTQADTDDAGGPESVDLDALAEINRAAYSWPEGFKVHPKLKKQLEKRREEFGPETTLDWAHGEVLAFGTLLRDGRALRLTGQDAERGTFSHRHLVLHDVDSGGEHTPIREDGTGRLEVYNSPLTETACLAFEYGYTVAGPDDLVLWEGQFGDFANVGQVIIDQFLSSGQAKWNQVSGLTLLLPHGYEGQGPEHSSARLERFLQLCAERNMTVAYPTTPAQYYHLLRRQAYQRPARPLVVMSPKSLLRLPAAASVATDLVDGGFEPVIDDPRISDPARVRRIVLCSGKFYYDLVGSLDESRSDVAVVRVEELYPFPGAELERLVSRYPAVTEVLWAQEEPRNMGALSYIGPRLRVAVPRTIPLRHVSRPERASPAEGYASDHKVEQERLIREATTV